VLGPHAERPPAQSAVATAGPSVPAITAPPSPRSSGSRFIGGVPMKRATNVLAGRLVELDRRAILLDPPRLSSTTRSAIDIASTWSCVT
jgi:hypothetical protein